MSVAAGFEAEPAITVESVGTALSAGFQTFEQEALTRWGYTRT
jgi:hypothetical protein